MSSLLLAFLLPGTQALAHESNYVPCTGEINLNDLGDLGNLGTTSRSRTITERAEELLSWGNSSGGGDFVRDRFNPWFIGNKSVKWCIRHGGEDNFSLPKSVAKKDIEKAIRLLATQVKELDMKEAYRRPVTRPDWTIPGFHGICGPDYCPEAGTFHSNGDWDMPEPYQRKYTHQNIQAGNFEYSENCQEADLEFLLGAIDDTRVQVLRSQITNGQFRSSLGFAVKTKNNAQKKWAKGVIYIAADKGPMSYTGARNIRFPAPTFWDLHHKLSPKAYPIGELVNFVTPLELRKTMKMKDVTTSALTAVAAHEIGHTMGFTHNNRQNLMDRDFPANVVKVGLISQDELNIVSQVFRRSIMKKKDFHVDLLFPSAFGSGLRIPYNSTLDRFLGNLEMKRFIFDVKEKNSSLYLFNNNQNAWPMELKRKAPLAISFCKDPILAGEVSYNYQDKTDTSDFGSRNSFSFDEEAGQWIETPLSAAQTEGDSWKSTKMTSFWHNELCGTIAFEGHQIGFSLFIDYYGYNSALKIKDPETQEEHTLNLKQTMVIPEPFSGRISRRMMAPFIYNHYPNY